MRSVNYARQALSNTETGLLTQIDIELREVGWVLFDQPQGFFDSAGHSHDRHSDLAQHILGIGGDDEIVIHHEDVA
jgi:hypothetical protein